MKDQKVKINLLYEDLKNKLDNLHFNIVKLFLKWTIQKAQFVKNISVYKKRKLLKGELFWCNFGFNIGSEFSSISANYSMRPCLVVRNNAFMNSKNVVVLPLTSFNPNKKIVYTDVVIAPNSRNKLTSKSIIKTANVRDVSIVRLGGFIGKLNQKDMQKVEDKLLDVFGIKKIAQK